MYGLPPGVVSNAICITNLSLFATGLPITVNTLKRGAEELLGTTNGGGTVSNGNGIGTHNGNGLVENNNDAKKAKLDRGNVGRPSKVIHIRNIPNEVSEAEIIHLGIPFGRVTNVLVLKGKNQAFLEMADESAASQMVDYFTTCSAQLRGRAVYVQFSNHKELKTDQTHSNSHATAQAALQAAQAFSGQLESEGGPNTVLRVIIDQMIYPITLDVLHQYPDVISAQSAKLSLDGQNIYNSCCTLRIEYSKLSNLNVKYNNDKSRDYTNPSLPNGDIGTALDAVQIPDQLLPQFLLTGTTPSTGAATTLQTVRRSVAQSDRLGSLPLAGFQLPAATTGGQIRLPIQLGNQSCVLLVSNLNEEMVSPDALFTLFGVYGDVIRVKILFNKKDCALVQMAEPQQAQLVILHMDKLRLFGKEIRIMQSKYATVQLPKDGQSDTGLTKDYSNSPLHRFKKPGSKNYQNIYSPSSTLHLSNIPQGMTEEELKTAFESNGFAVKDFRFFAKDHRMALLQLESLDEAVAALIKMHNYRLGELSHLRVSFSKSNIQ